MFAIKNELVSRANLQVMRVLAIAAVIGFFYSSLLPASAVDTQKPSTKRTTPLQLGVCFHNYEEYNPAAAKVLDDLRGAGSFWIRGDYEHPAKDAVFAKDMEKKKIKTLALLVAYKKRSLAEWTKYVESEVKALPNVDAWEVHNEPEMTWWGGPTPAPEYIRMAKEAHRIIKAANPNALVVGPAVGATAGGIKYLKQLIDGGVLDYLDAISFHYYIFHKNLDVEGIKKVVAGRKPLWITETGWTVADQAGGEAAQAKYVREYYDPEKGKLGSDPAIRVIFNYELNDDHFPLPKGKDDGWGLTCGAKGQFKRKQAYADFKALVKKVNETK